MKQNQQITAAAIRKHLGHGQGNRRVRVARDGRVTYYGSTSDTDRQHDYWHDGGWVRDYAGPIRYEQEQR